MFRAENGNARIQKLKWEVVFHMLKIQVDAALKCSMIAIETLAILEQLPVQEMITKPNGCPE